MHWRRVHRGMLREWRRVPWTPSRLDMLVVLFVGMLWVRVSDIAIAEHGLPSLTVPFALGLIGMSLWRRLEAGERLGVRTLRGLVPVVPYLAVVSLSAFWATAPQRALQTAIDLTKDLLILWVLVELIASIPLLKACCLSVVLTAGVGSVASEFYPHNLYLQVAAETGSLGLLTFLLAALGPLLGLERMRRAARRSVGTDPEWLELTVGVEIALACYLAASVTLHASYPRYLWMLLALAMAARRMHLAVGART